MVATDLEPSKADQAGWSETGQHADAIEDLPIQDLCWPELFYQRASFRYVNMNAIPCDLRNFDFTWSSCALEHVGSLEGAMAFVLNQMECLRPGGVAVHTTEFNVSSKAETITEGHTVYFRRSDAEHLADQLRKAGYSLELSFDTGRTLEDRHVDQFPYDTARHLKVQADR